MKTFSHIPEIQAYIAELRMAGKTVGLVPTMGALHNGHLSLIAQARESNDVVVCSIFVNPTQFTDASDLEKYPRPIADDINKLESAYCDILFAPEVDEMYADNETWHLDIGAAEHLLEGKYRPGHYQGVTQVVSKLFNIIKPDKAFFGQKDYQQFLVIRIMVKLMHIPEELVMCPIEREPDGLAMSSRNIHLSSVERQQALILSQALFSLKDNFSPHNIKELLAKAKMLIDNEPGVEQEYFEIADGENLHPANENSISIVALVAAKVGNTRLIDNVILVRGS